MASLQEIERELQAIDAGVFQQLCDEFLFYSEGGFPAINRPGSQKGKRKTKKGTPDTYWMLPSGKYVFCEYTTKNKGDSKSAFLKKLKDDLSKCLDSTKTGISADLIRKIILCFNSELLPKEMEEVKEVVGESHIEISFLSLDALAMNLYSRYPNLAYRYLGVSIDTGQVLPTDVFIREYSSNGTITTPLTNKFLFREEELEKIKNNLRNNDIVILTGQPGFGKSKLAIEVLKQWQNEHTDYDVYCLSNKNVNIFEDLKTYIKPHKDYVVFIDDANRQSENLRSILTLQKTSRTGNLKVIITIRDYALDFINRICNGLKYKIEELYPLSDKQLESLLNSEDFGITNPSYVQRILQIAKGNPRIAIMVARLAVEHQNLEVLYDLFDIYDSYFTTFINDHTLLSKIEIQKALGLVSFFYTIDRSDKEKFQKLLNVFELNYHKFSEALVELENMELVESSFDNSIVKIGDQVLSTYFFYKSFIKDRVLPFKTLLYNYFDQYTNRFRDTLIPSQSDFGYQKVIDPIQKDLVEFFEGVSTDSKVAHKFLKTFWFTIPDHTLAFIQSIIEELPIEQNAEFIADAKDRNQKAIDDVNLKILEGFFLQYSDLVLSGLELAFDYVEKRPILFNELYKSIISSFIFTYEDEPYGFYRQNKLIDFLIENSSDDHPIYLRMFFYIFPTMMASAKMVCSNSWKRNEISLYKYCLPNDKFIRAIRKKIWVFTNDSFGKDKEHAEEAVFNYIKDSTDFVKEILEYDLKYLNDVVVKHFVPTSFTYCYYVQKLIERYERIGIGYDRFFELKDVYYSPDYRLYRLLDMNLLRNKLQHEYENVDYDKFERIKEIEIRYKVRLNTLDQFNKFYTSFCSIWSNSHIHNSGLNASLDIIILETYQFNKELSLSFLKAIQAQGNPTGFKPARIFNFLNQGEVESLDEIFDLISSIDYSGKTHWVLSFSFYLREELITYRYCKEVLSVYEKLTHHVYLHFSSLEKFLKIDSRFFVKILQFFIDRYDEGVLLTLDHDFFEKYTVSLRPSTSF